MNTKLKALIGIAAIATLPLIVWPADDTDVTVRVQTRPRVLRATVEWDESGNLLAIRDYMFLVRYEDTVRVAATQIASAEFSRQALIDAGTVQSNLVLRLEAHSAWAKNNWPVPEPPVAP